MVMISALRLCIVHLNITASLQVTTFWFVSQFTSMNG